MLTLFDNMFDKLQKVRIGRRLPHTLCDHIQILAARVFNSHFSKSCKNQRPTVENLNRSSDVFLFSTNHSIRTSRVEVVQRIHSREKDDLLMLNMHQFFQNAELLFVDVRVINAKFKMIQSDYFAAITWNFPFPRRCHLSKI